MVTIRPKGEPHSPRFTQRFTPVSDTNSGRSGEPLRYKVNLDEPFPYPRVHACAQARMIPGRDRFTRFTRFTHRGGLAPILAKRKPTVRITPLAREDETEEPSP